MEQITLPTGIVIRKAATRDCDEISALNVLTKRPERTDVLFEEYFVAETARELVGCAALRCRHDSGYLYGLTVHPRWRRQGIGHSLTNHRLESTQAKGIQTVLVFAMFWNVNFFKRHGFALAKKTLTSELRWLHKDFEDAWCRRSALLVLSLEPLRSGSPAK